MSDEVLSEETNTRLALRVREVLSRCRNCAQTSFSVLDEEFGLDGGPVLRALTPFPGIALRGETCGAVVGSLMALGLVYGREDLDDWHGYVRSLPPARRFCRRFQEQNGSTACANILEAKMGRAYNLADPAQAMEYAAAGGEAACGEVIAGAVQVAAQLIAREKR